MKYSLVITFLACTFLFSCTKEATKPQSPASIQTSSAVFFNSSNIAIQNFKAQAANNQITVGFSTTFQKDVKSLEILKGTSRTSLCSIYKINGLSSATTVVQYSTNDTQTASTLYYIVKYTLQDGDWGYTPIFTLQTDK